MDPDPETLLQSIPVRSQSTRQKVTIEAFAGGDVLQESPKSSSQLWIEVARQVAYPERAESVVQLDASGGIEPSFVHDDQFS